VNERRIVRPTRDFFEQVDRRLPAERPGDGGPSRVDFLTYELFGVMERFATGWEGLPALSVPGFRILISEGHTLYAYSVIGAEQDDGSIELIRLEIDQQPLFEDHPP